MEEDIEYAKVFKIEISNEEAKEILKSVLNRIEIRGAELYVVKQAIKQVLKENEKKDKIIDLMAEYISKLTDCPFENEKEYLDCEKMCDIRTDKECWKQYFENKVKEV